MKLLADAVAMRQRLEALEARVASLEAQVASAASAASARRSSVRPPTSMRPAGNAASAPPRPTAARRPGAGPPPLPPMQAPMPPVSRSGGRRSIVDISEIAELVGESLVPPAPRSKK